MTTESCGQSYYDILQVSRGASAAVVRASYRALAQNRHPDKNTADPQRAHQDMQALNEAYKVLSDPDLRSKYDSELRERDAEVEGVVRPTQDRERQEAWRARQAAGATSAASARPPPPKASDPRERQQAGERYKGATAAASASAYRASAEMSWISKAVRFLTGTWPATALSGLVWLVILLNIFGALRTTPKASGDFTAPPQAAGTRVGAAPLGPGKYVTDPILLAKLNAPEAPAPSPSTTPPALTPHASESELQTQALYNRELARLEQNIPLINADHSFAFDQQFFEDVVERKKAARSTGASPIDALRVALQEACRAEVEINADCARTQDANARCALARVRAFYCSRGRN